MGAVAPSMCAAMSTGIFLDCSVVGVTTDASVIKCALTPTLSTTGPHMSLENALARGIGVNVESAT
eukprot:4572796-Alexandrium_andersonii.AAC.1